MKRILVAGVGNIFLGDDAFGCEVISRLSRRSLPAGVQVVDFGIRSYDLAYALAEGYDAVILVDAAPRGNPPGTLYLIEPDTAPREPDASMPVDPHSLNPVRVLELAESIGGKIERLYLVGCEPAVLDSEDGQLGLSAPVQAAVPRALERIESLVCELLGSETKIVAGIGPARKEMCI